jgi:DNA-binding CsgD family transcriptional regulator
MRGLAAEGRTVLVSSHLSPLTVKTHVNRARAKLDARDRAQLVVLAYQTGLVRVGTDQ